MNISRPPLCGFVTSETFFYNFRNRKYKHLLSCTTSCGAFLENSKLNIFSYSYILISLDVVITKDQLSGDNKTNLVFMMRPIITRETESSQHTTRGSHYICCDFRDRVSRLLLTMTDGKIFYPASITSQKLTLSQYSHSQI